MEDNERRAQLQQRGHGARRLVAHVWHCRCRLWRAAAGHSGQPASPARPPRPARLLTGAPYYHPSPFRECRPVRGD
jgi:hypothetical protein